MYKHKRIIAAALCCCAACLLISCNRKTEQTGTQQTISSTTQPGTTQSGTTKPETTITTQVTQASSRTSTTQTQKSTEQSTKKTVTTTVKKVTTTARPSTTQSQKEKDAAFAKEVLRLCNKERKKEGLSALKYGNQTLQVCVDVRAKEAQKSFSHTRPNGEEFYDVFEEKSLSYGFCGENLAQLGSKSVTAESLVRGWMNSPSHRHNILSANYQYMALGRSGNTFAQLLYTPA